MMSMAFERRHRIRLVRFFGIFSSDDIDQVDAASRWFVYLEGATPGIFDWSGVQAIAAPQSLMIERGRRPQIALGQLRVMVAPTRLTYEVVRAYAHQQRDFGNVEPAVVRTLADAYALFGLIDPHFEPVCLGVALG